MSELSCFLAGNVKKAENIKIAVSDRFVDGDGSPVKWEFKPLTAEEDEEIRRRYTKRVQITGKKNQFTNDFDGNGYLTAMVAARTVYPDLNNAELQNSYGVMGAEKLLNKMLYKDEFDRLTEKLMAASETETMDELVDEAKNS